MGIYHQILMLKPKETKLVLWSFFYFFCLLSGYFLLRPLRDEMGIINGANRMQWLFTGTFVCMLLLAPIFGYFTKKFAMRHVIMGSYLFFIINLFIFYLCFVFTGKSGLLASIFFIWLSVFNLFVVSLFWSLMADVFSSKSSKRTFGIVAAGGSLGALTGPLLSQYITMYFAMEYLILMAMAFLGFTIMAIYKITELKDIKGFSRAVHPFNTEFKLQRKYWKSLLAALKSRYILGIVLFILMYTSVSTILYFEQAHIIEDSVSESTERLLYFSRVDFATNSLTLVAQFFVTNRVIKKFGLSATLAIVPILLAIGFFVLSAKLNLICIAALIVLHRAGNFSLLKPSREILFTVCSKEEKYRVKNFIDTAVYRGGDALMGWLFTLFLTLGFGLSAIALLAIPIVIMWAFLGFKLGRKQLKKELILEHHEA